MSWARNNLIRALNRLFRQTVGLINKKEPKLMGEDHLGNKYYEEERPQHDYRKIQRYYEPKFPRRPGPVVDLMDIPPEWEAWLRFRRKDPPASRDSPQERLAKDSEARKIEQNKTEM